MNAISASRRTDLPALYWRWFMNRVEVGHCRVANPFNPRQVREVSLRASDVVAIVFWTRNSAPMLADVDHLNREGYSFYVHHTLNDYPREIEPHVPDADVAVAGLRALSDRVGPARVIWRYDPILFSSATPLEYHVERFVALARRLRGAATSVYVSFCDPYGKTRRNLTRLSTQLGWTFGSERAEERSQLAGRLAQAAAESGMQLYTCAESGLDVQGVRPGHCVDRELLSKLRPDLDLHLQAAPTRAGCGCVESVDIGAYDTCTQGCVYCYANRGRELSRRRHAAHDPNGSMLGD